MNIRTRLVLASALGLLVHANVFAADWDGEASDNNFTTPKNWNDNKAPNDPKGTYQITNGDTVELSGQTSIGRMMINGGSVLNVNGGQHYHGQAGNNIRDIYFRASGGTVNQTGGVYDVGHMISIGSGDARQGGTYNLTDGELIASRGSKTMIKSNVDNAPTASIEIGDDLDNNTALLNVSGRSSVLTRAGMTLGPTGVLSITGSRATVGIGSYRNVDGAWSQMAGGTIKFVLDQNGPSRILIADTDDKPGVKIDFQPGALLELGFAEGTEPYPGEWVIFEAEGTVFDAATVSGLTLSADTTPAEGGWSFTFDNRNGNGVLVATYAPVVVAEPE